MPAESPHISVVILNWNRPEDTLQAVRSVLGQSCADLEVVVWDNASTDGSREVLTDAFASDPRVRLVWSERNYGVAGGRNRAFAAARGRILFSLDSDAVIETRDGLDLVAAVFENEPGVGVVGAEVLRPDRHLMWPFARPASEWRERRFDTIRLDGCAFATRRELFERIGGFAEHFSPYGQEDHYYAFQVLGAGFRVVYVPAIKVVHAFNPVGRQGEQFAMVVRNGLWIPLELFPFPHNLLRAVSRSMHFAREAAEDKQWRFFFQGFSQGFAAMRRRRPMPRKAWRRVAALIREDKALGKAYDTGNVHG
ncbi:MAG: glycosyltransferase family 2 protein [Kiritimatiellae bacterium]|nr:glycosyltransferase family 2 protein [Kiritimatiellia bacterium]